MTTDHGTVTETVAVAAPGPESPSAEGAAPAQLWVERTGTRTYTGRSSRGAEVLIGPAEAGAVFTPGELLKIALAGCSGMTADAALARRLGDDVAVVVRVSGQSDPAEDRYEHLREEMVVDLSGLDDTAKARLLTVVNRAIESHCTVARTLTNGATVELTIEGEG
ncbi:OsmC family protein [Cellulomonas aerilata]|uniref:Osmotically inducible protein C n=1 Tax=Cellulomonas aerilata TaxID=515326 RepID=A0A512DDJ4_9CELL|nr:OsmC family protein [Cellulomonas aerilata]GEO34546.1 hypothetical protein CAE01nite_22710 [Cellulomonas aerilata]